MTIDSAIDLLCHYGDIYPAEARDAAAFIRSEFSRLQAENASLHDTLERIKLANTIEEQDDSQEFVTWLLEVSRPTQTE
jgi:hypothetical protein